MTQNRLHLIGSRIVILLLSVMATACSFAPKTINSVQEISSQIVTEETNHPVLGANIYLSRCFLPRSIIPICQNVPLAKYQSDAEGAFSMLVSMKGHYDLDVFACIDETLYSGWTNFEVITGSELLPPIELRARYGKSCEERSQSARILPALSEELIAKESFTLSQAEFDQLKPLQTARFEKVDSDGNPLSDDALAWTCVYDGLTDKTWLIPKKRISTTWWKRHRSKDIYLGYHYQPCGLDSWRIPSKEELESLVIPSKAAPKINTFYFPDTRKDDYWSSDKHLFLPFSAWTVSFEHGYTWSWNASFDGYLRLVAD